LEVPRELEILIESICNDKEEESPRCGAKAFDVLCTELDHVATNIATAAASPLPPCVSDDDFAVSWDMPSAGGPHGSPEGVDPFDFEFFSPAASPAPAAAQGTLPTPKALVRPVALPRPGVSASPIVAASNGASEDLLGLF